MEFDGPQPSIFLTRRHVGVFTVTVPGDFAEEGEGGLDASKSRRRALRAGADRRGCLRAALPADGDGIVSPPLLQLSEDRPELWGATTGIYAESPDRVFVIQRGELPRPEGIEPGWDAIAATPGNRAIAGNRFEHCIHVVDSSGRIIEAWDQWDHLFPGGRGPHQVAINPYDPERHVWVVDDLLHQVFKFTNDGEELVLTLGERLVPGDDGAHFNRPTGIAFFPDGSTFVSDGYTNTRVVKFDGEGNFLMAWGEPGTGPGQFNLPHAIATDASGRVYVADRSNSRIQVFDENGNFLDVWPDINSPFAIQVSADGHLWVADGQTNKMLKYNLDGQLVYGFGTYGLELGFSWGIHGFHADNERKPLLGRNVHRSGAKDASPTRRRTHASDSASAHALKGCCRPGSRGPTGGRVPPRPGRFRLPSR